MNDTQLLMSLFDFGTTLRSDGTGTEPNSDSSNGNSSELTENNESSSELHTDNDGNESSSDWQTTDYDSEESSDSNTTINGESSGGPNNQPNGDPDNQPNGDPGNQPNGGPNGGPNGQLNYELHDDSNQESDGDEAATNASNEGRAPSEAPSEAHSINEDGCGCDHTGGDNSECHHTTTRSLDYDDSRGLRCCKCGAIGPDTSCDVPGCSCTLHQDCPTTNGYH